MDLNLPGNRVYTDSASLWKRAVAFLIDLFILNLVIQFTFSGLIERIVPEEVLVEDTYTFLHTNETIGGALVMISAFALILFYVYFVLLENKMQQSIGKKFMNIYVVSVGTESTVPALWQHMVRGMFLIPVFPFVMLWVVDPVVMFFTKERRRLSDRISKTKVVQQYAL